MQKCGHWKITVCPRLLNLLCLGGIMNRTRCPWCGKRIDKRKDTISWQDVFASPSVPRMLRKAKCGHCGKKYGQVPIVQFMLGIGIAAAVILVLALAFGSALLLVIALATGFLTCLTPYSKLDDKGKACDEEPDLVCEIVVIEKYQKLRHYDLYFLDTSIDEQKPFTGVSPIEIHSLSPNGDVLYGEFLYRHEKNRVYLQEASCLLYDAKMNLAAKIAFVRETDTMPQ